LEKKDTKTGSLSNSVEAGMATLVVKRLVESGSVRAGEIGVLTPYEAQTSLIKAMLEKARLGDVGAANFDAFQGREHEVIVVSFVRPNSGGRLGHVDDGRRLNVALTRARRGLVIIGDKDTLKHGFKSGLISFA
jgi:superfamily I DNA and/or RNA helicase